jgi:hypothetical protein
MINNKTSNVDESSLLQKLVEVMPLKSALGSQLTQRIAPEWDKRAEIVNPKFTGQMQSSLSFQVKACKLKTYATF